MKMGFAVRKMPAVDLFLPLRGAWIRGQTRVYGGLAL